MGAVIAARLQPVHRRQPRQGKFLPRRWSKAPQNKNIMNRQFQVLIFISVIFYVNAIKCYNCGGLGIADCDGETLPAAQVDCTGATPKCIKGHTMHGDDETWMRGCTLDSPNGCSYTTSDSSIDVTMESCVCDTELCNSAPSWLMSKTSIILAAVAPILMYHLL